MLPNEVDKPVVGFLSIISVPLYNLYLHIILNKYLRYLSHDIITLKSNI